MATVDSAQPGGGAGTGTDSPRLLLRRTPDPLSDGKHRNKEICAAGTIRRLDETGGQILPAVGICERIESQEMEI